MLRAPMCRVSRSGSHSLRSGLLSALQQLDLFSNSQRTAGTLAAYASESRLRSCDTHYDRFNRVHHRHPRLH